MAIEARSMSLDIDNIMSQEDINGLFTGNGKSELETPENEKTGNNQPEGSQNETIEKNTDTADVSPDNLFDEKPGSLESVSSGNNQEKGEHPDTNGAGSSPKNFYSSTASALKEDGVLPDLEDSVIEGIKTPEDLSEAIQAHIDSQLNEKQKRIDTALRGGIEPNEVKQYEETLEILDGITDESVTDEGEQGQNLRKQLIYNDAINRGFSKERALREVNTSFEKGNDVDDAKEALQSSKDFYTGKYNEIIEQAKQNEQEYRRGLKEQAEQFRKELLDDKEVFKGITLDAKSRKAAYEAMTKPIAKDENGNYLTSIQKYDKEHPLEFRKKLGVIYALTNGFEDLSGLIKGPVKKEVKSKLRELEHTFNSTRTFPDGSLNYEGNGERNEGILGGEFDLDI